MTALRNRCGRYILSCVFFYLLSIYLSNLYFFLAYSQPSQIGCLPYFHTSFGPSANLGCRSETCCMQLARNAGGKKSPKIGHLRTITQFCRAISSQLRHVLTIRKKFLNSIISSTCPHNMLNFGPLTAEICWRVWGTPVNFNGFRVLAALLHGTLVVGVSHTLRR